MIGGIVLEGNKFIGGFDLCIISMMSYIMSEVGQEGLGIIIKILYVSVLSKRL